MLIISTADDHLSPFIWTSHRAIAQDSYYAMGMITNAIVDIKRKAGDEEVVLLKAGDIFDTTTPDPLTEQVLKANIKMLVDAGVHVLSIQGNHEFHSKVPRASLFGTFPLDCPPGGPIRPVTIEGVVFVGIDYTASSAELHEKIAMVPPCDYLILHSPFRHLLGFADKYQIEKDDIPAHVKNVVVGDIHKQNVTKNSQGVYILSPGSSHPRKIPEITEGHGFYIHKHEDGITSGRFENFEPRRYYMYNIENDAGIDSLKRLKVETDKQLQPVIILEVVSELYKQAMNIAESTGALVVPKAILKIDESVKMDNISEVDIPELIDALPTVVQRKSEPGVFSLLEQLLASDDPESVLEETRNKMEVS